MKTSVPGKFILVRKVSAISSKFKQAKALKEIAQLDTEVKKKSIRLKFDLKKALEKWCKIKKKIEKCSYQS